MDKAKRDETTVSCVRVLAAGSFGTLMKKNDYLLRKDLVDGELEALKYVCNSGTQEGWVTLASMYWSMTG